MFGQEAQAPSIQKSIISSMKNGTLDGYTKCTSYVIARAKFDCAGVWEFSQHHPPNTGEDQKELLPSECGAPGTVPYGKSSSGYCITYIKRFDKSLRYHLLEKKPLVLP